LVLAAFFARDLATVIAPVVVPLDVRKFVERRR
jgi:hypothetical protein